MRVLLRVAGFGALAVVALWSVFQLVPSAERHVVPRAQAAALTGIHKIRHVVIIMQENRSFDSFFGTFPGADGIPMSNGVPTVCVPDPFAHHCVRPFHTAADLNLGGPHDHIGCGPGYQSREDGRVHQVGPRWP